MHLVESRIDSTATSPRSIRLSRKQLRSTQRYFQLTKCRDQSHEIWIHSILHVFLFYLFLLIQFFKICIITLSLTLWSTCQLWPQYPLSRIIFDFFLNYLLQGHDPAPHRINPYNYCYSDKKLPLLLCIKEILSNWKYSEDIEYFLHTKQLSMQTKTQNCRVLSTIALNKK
jgi:hypothetical protein